MEIIKKAIVVFVIFLFTVGLAGCQEKGAGEKAGEKVDEAVEKAGEAMEQAGEKVGEAMEKVGEKSE